MREERRLVVFENRVPRRIFGPKGRKWWDALEDCIMSFMTCMLHQVLCWKWKIRTKIKKMNEAGWAPELI
jgi:hypothetical protein